MGLNVLSPFSIFPSHLLLSEDNLFQELTNQKRAALDTSFKDKSNCITRNLSTTKRQEGFSQ